MNIKENFGKMNKRRLKYGSFATALTVFVIAAIVLVNIVATMLFDRFPITLDLTSGSIYTISEETAGYIESLEVPVSITVMATEEEYRSISEFTAQTVELLKNYSQHNGGISVSYVDRLSNPDFVAAYNVELNNGDIVVEPDDGKHERVKIVSLTDIIVVPDDYSATLAQMSQVYGALRTHQMFNSYGYIRSSSAEQAITSAIMAVTDANPVTVAVLSREGANESDVSGLTMLLDRNGYLLTEVNISTEDLSDDIDLVIIPAPKVDYSEEEIRKLEVWLEGGGMLEKDFIYVASVEQTDTPNLDGLLYKYGMTVEKKVIHETDTRRYSQYDTYTYQDIVATTEAYYKDVTNPELPLVAPDARPITTRFGNVDSTYACEPVVSSAASASLGEMGEAEWDPETVTERGVYNTVVVGKQEKINQDTHISTYTYAIVFGSDKMLNAYLTQNASFNNGYFIISMLNEITGKSEGITITPKIVNTGTFDITEAQTRTLTLVFALVIPVAVLAVGTFVWIRRRHR